MALFQGEDMVDVTTPDGRTITLPRSLAAMVGGPQPLPSSNTLGGIPGAAPAPDLLPPLPPQAAPAPDVNSPTLAGLSGAPVQEAAPEEAPPAVDMAPEIVTANPQRVAKARKAQAAYDASPEGIRAADQKRQEEAAQQTKGAIVDETAIDAATNDLIAGSIGERNKTLNQIDADKNAAMQEQVAQIDKVNTRVNNIRDKIAKTKIDRSLDHPVLASIFAALAGIGSAMSKPFNQGPVNTLEILNNVLDRKVKGQMEDLDQMGKVYGMSKDQLELLKEQGKSKLELYNTMFAAETAKAIRQVEEITARSASPKAKANGEKLIAALNQQLADKTTEAVHWGLDFDQKAKQHAEQIKLGYAGIAEQRYSTNVNAQIAREKNAADLAIAMASKQQAGDAAAAKQQAEDAKDLSERGVRDVNGEYLLTGEGKKAMAQAEEFDKQAAALADNPAAADKVKLLQQKAAILRADARTQYAVKGHSAPDATATTNMVSSGQSVVQLIDGIKALSNQVGRGLISRDAAQVKLRGMFNQLKPGLKEAWQLGAWDKGASNLVEQIIGGDPTSDWNVGAAGMVTLRKMYEDPKAFQQGLDSVSEQLEVSAKNKLVGLGAKFDKGETVFQHGPATEVSEAGTALGAGRTPIELEQNARSKGEGLIKAGVHQLGYDVHRAVIDASGPKSAEDEANRSANSGSVKYPGLSPEQGSAFESLMQRYKSGDKKAGEELITNVADAAKKGRTSLVVPMLQHIGEFGDPGLYAAARAAIPKGSEADQTMDYTEKNRVGTAAQYDLNPQLFVNQVLSSAVNGKIQDEAGKQEIGRRALKGDPVARKALVQIMNGKVR